MEKVLIEACLEVAASGRIEGLQDLGAAGLTSAAVEFASNANSGIEIYIDNVHLRDSGMEPYEIMLSETQERMLISVSKENLEYVQGIFNKWEVDCTLIGKTTDDGMTKIYEGGELRADVPVCLLYTSPSPRD